MKKCPNGHEVNDILRFCPKCGAELNEINMKFCKKCGNKREGTEKFCSKCGTPFEGVPTSLSVSRPIPSYDTEETSTDYKKIIIPIVIGIIIIALIGGGWYGYKEYCAYSEKKQAREKFVTDSLEQARKDSIRLAEQMEQERIEAEKLAEFRNKMSFENFVGMLSHYDKESYAKKCGLTLLYKNVTEEEFGESIEIVYGYDVEKGDKKDWSYEILSKSNHACYFQYNLDTSTGACLSFIDEEDANIFYNKAKEYGLIKYMDTYYIPNKKLSRGQTIIVDEFDNSIFENVIGAISSPYYREGWYTVSIGLDGY